MVKNNWPSPWSWVIGVVHVHRRGRQQHAHRPVSSPFRAMAHHTVDLVQVLAECHGLGRRGDGVLQQHGGILGFEHPRFRDGRGQRLAACHRERPRRPSAPRDSCGLADGWSTMSLSHGNAPATAVRPSRTGSATTRLDRFIAAAGIDRFMAAARPGETGAVSAWMIRFRGFRTRAVHEPDLDHGPHAVTSRTSSAPAPRRIASARSKTPWSAQATATANLSTAASGT